MTTPSLAERVIALIAQRLAAVSVDVCGTPTPLKVFRSVRTLDPGDLPAAVIWDQGESVADTSGSGSYASMMIALNLAIDGHVPADQATTGIAIETVKAAIKAAALLPGGPLIDATGPIGILTYLGTDAAAREDGATSESVSVRVTATYKEAIGDPTRSR